MKSLLLILLAIACSASQSAPAQAAPAALAAEVTAKPELDQLLTEYEAQEKACDAEIEPQLKAARDQYQSVLEALKTKYTQAKRVAEADKIEGEIKRYAERGMKNEPGKDMPAEVRSGWNALTRTTEEANKSVALKRTAARARFLQGLTPLAQNYRAQNDLDGMILVRRAHAAASIRSAVEANRLAATDIFGQGSAPWQDVASEGGYLVGFEVGKGGWAVHSVVGMLRPIFATARGLRDGEGRGYAKGDRIMAKEGYAVGGLNVISPMIVFRVQVVFMRINADGLSLNPQDSYVSDWLGGDKTPRDSKPRELTSRGRIVIGITGDTGSGRVDSVGLVHLK